MPDEEPALLRLELEGTWRDKGKTDSGETARSVALMMMGLLVADCEWAEETYFLTPPLDPAPRLEAASVVGLRGLLDVPMSMSSSLCKPR